MNKGWLRWWYIALLEWDGRLVKRKGGIINIRLDSGSEYSEPLLAPYYNEDE